MQGLALVVAGILGHSPGALANDGFYQGAGNHLFLVKNDGLRVRRETLHIVGIEPPLCHDVLYRGETIPMPPLSQDIKFGTCPDPKAFSLGAPRPCADGWVPWRVFSSRWRADAVYEVAALVPVPTVKIGFPVPTWHLEYMCGRGLDGWTTLPGVVQFETFIDGTKVAKTAVHELQDATGPGTLGYTWTASFEKPGPYTLRTTYDFGVDTVNAFYERHGYPVGLRPWFLPADSERWGGAERLVYYLTPIRSWAEPPPDSIRVVVDLPRDIPVTYFVPVQVRPTCVDEHAYVFAFAREFPAGDIDVAYPMKRSPRPGIRTAVQWSAWKASLGAGVKLTCRLRDHLAGEADTPLGDVIRATPCVERCLP